MIEGRGGVLRIEIMKKYRTECVKNFLSNM